MIFEELSFQCPYCGEEIQIEVIPDDGSQQSFVSDCDVCCRPIQFDLSFEEHALKDYRITTQYG